MICSRKILSGILVLLCLTGLRDRVLTQSLPDFKYLHDNLKTYEFPSGEITTILEDSTLCKFNFSQGMLNGQWTTYYKNGNVKAIGQFTKNRMTGTWKVFNASGKSFLELEFDNEGSYKLNRVRYGFLNNPVRKGKGKVFFSAFGSSGLDADNAYYATVRYRSGKKNGKVEEFFNNDSLRASYTFKGGKYDGEYFFRDRFSNRTLNAHYKNGAPVGIWTSTVNARKKTTDWNEKPFVQRIPGRYYISEHEVIATKSLKKVIHSSFEGVSELFEPDSSGVSVFSLLQNAFIFDETTFYDDQNLSKLVLSSVKRSSLTGFDMSKENSMKPVMIFYNDFYFYSAQSSNINNTALILTIVLSYYDEKGKDRLVSIPFIYIPETFVDLKDKKIHNKTFGELFLRIINNNYPSVTVNSSSGYNRYMYEIDENWLLKHFNPVLNLMNMTHDLWLYNTGIIR